MSRVRIAILGCGIAGRARARAIAERDDAELVAVHRGRFAHELGAPVFDDGHQAIAAAEVVIVSSTSRTHQGWVMRALQAGRDVIVEFPLTTAPNTGDAAAWMFDEARRLGRMLHVEHIERLSPTTGFMVERCAQTTPTSVDVVFAGRGDPFGSGREHALAQVARLHRIVAAHGWPSRMVVRRADGEGISALLTCDHGVRVRLTATRGPDLERGLTWTARTDDASWSIRGRSAFDGEDQVELPATSLFADDLDHALRRRRDGIAPYVSDAEVVGVLGLADRLAERGVHEHLPDPRRSGR